MKIDINDIFKYKVINELKLLDYGFKKTNFGFIKEIPIIGNKFNMIITIYADGSVQYKVVDTEEREEYIPVSVKSAEGSFIGKIREACEKFLLEISQKCFDTEMFKGEQTKRILDFIRSKHETEPEFLWERYPDYAVFRRHDNDKWFALIMTVDKAKLGFSKHENAEIIDLKADPHYVKCLLDEEGFYPAYHMNKKHWFTVFLDESISDDIIFSLISSSFECVGDK